jgi:hypothetical protein
MKLAPLRYDNTILEGKSYDTTKLFGFSRRLPLATNNKGSELVLWYSVTWWRCLVLPTNKRHKITCHHSVDVSKETLRLRVIALTLVQFLSCIHNEAPTGLAVMVSGNIFNLTHEALNR